MTVRPSQYRSLFYISFRYITCLSAMSFIFKAKNYMSGKVLKFQMKMKTKCLILTTPLPLILLLGHVQISFNSTNFEIDIMILLVCKVFMVSCYMKTLQLMFLTT
jgi:hypothetical protein